MADLFDGTPDERPPDPRGEWFRGGWQFGLPEGTELEIRFECPECGDWAASEELQIPSLNLMAEKARDMATTEEFEAWCDQCGSEYELYITNEVGGAYVDSYTTGVAQGPMEHRVVSSAPDYFDEYADAVAANEDFHATFKTGLNTVRSLADEGSKLGRTLADAMYKMLFANVVTLLETYLSDALVVTTMANGDRVGKALRRLGHFQARTVQMSQVLDLAAEVDSEVRRYLVSVLYHDLDRVAKLYVKILGVRLPETPTPLLEAILTRHDIVHRNGKTKEGDDVELGAAEVRALANTVEEFVAAIDSSLKNLDGPAPPDYE